MEQMETQLGFTFVDLLKQMADLKASDLHIRANEPPKARVMGRVIPLEGRPVLTAGDSARLCLSVMNSEQKKILETRKNVDFSFGVEGVGRFRANVFMQKGTVAGVFRRIPYKFLQLEELGLPLHSLSLPKHDYGLILVTGPTGSGKSTTLAAFINWINENEEKHIVTLEDPIEYWFESKKSTITQREVGSDVATFQEGLKYVLRQDPDVVMIGEMRDPASVEAALQVAETGHLVFATLHTNTAIETIHRIVSIFESDRQEYIRQMLATVLVGVLCQRLLPRADGQGMVLAVEYLYCTPSVRNLIRSGKLEQIVSAMLSGARTHGMVTMQQSLDYLKSKGLITKEVYDKHKLMLEAQRGK